MRISERIRGRVCGELKAPIPESFLNRCMEEGLALSAVTRCDACTLRFWAEESDWTAIERAAETCQAELQRMETSGGSRDRRLLRRRSILLLPLYILGLTLAQLLTEVSPRVHYSVLPMLILLAAFSYTRPVKKS